MPTTEARARARLTALLVGLALTGCPGATGDDAGVTDAGPSDAGTDDGGVTPTDGGADDDAGVGPLYLTELATLDDLHALAGEGGWVKFLAPIDGRAREAPLLDDCYFQNMAVTDYHVFFLQQFEATADITYDEYIAWVLDRPTRKWWGGGVQLVDEAHPGGAGAQTLLYTVYAQQLGESALQVDDIIEVDGILKSCVTFAPELLAFYPGDNSQRALAQEQIGTLNDAGVAVRLAP